jgi:hypothetical protein
MRRANPIRPCARSGLQPREHQGCGGPIGVPAGTGTVGAIESGCTPGGSCDGDSMFGGVMTIGGGTTAGAGALVCAGLAGLAGVTGDCGGRTDGALDGGGGPAGMATAGAAVEGTGIAVDSGGAGEKDRSCACASGAAVQRARMSDSGRTSCMMGACRKPLVSLSAKRIVFRTCGVEPKARRRRVRAVGVHRHPASSAPGLSRDLAQRGAGWVQAGGIERRGPRGERPSLRQRGCLRKGRCRGEPRVRARRVWGRAGLPGSDAR